MGESSEFDTPEAKEQDDKKKYERNKEKYYTTIPENYKNINTNILHESWDIDAFDSKKRGERAAYNSVIKEMENVKEESFRSGKPFNEKEAKQSVRNKIKELQEYPEYYDTYGKITGKHEWDKPYRQTLKNIEERYLK